MRFPARARAITQQVGSLARDAFAVANSGHSDARFDGAKMPRTNATSCRGKMESEMPMSRKKEEKRHSRIRQKKTRKAASQARPKGFLVVAELRGGVDVIGFAVWRPGRNIGRTLTLVRPLRDETAAARVRALFGEARALCGMTQASRRSGIG